MKNRYYVKKINSDCWAVVDSWDMDNTRYPHSESEAIELCRYNNQTWRDRPSDEEIAREIFTPDEFEDWLLNYDEGIS